MLVSDVNLRNCILQYFDYKKIKVKRLFDSISANPDLRTYFMDEIDQVLNDNLEYFDKNEEQLKKQLEEVRKDIDNNLPCNDQLDLINSELIRYDFFLIIRKSVYLSLVKTSWYNPKNTIELIE